MTNTGPASPPSQADDGVAEAPPAPQATNLSAIVAGIVNDAKTLISDVLALGQAEIKPMSKHLGLGVGLFAAAAFFALNALILLFSAGALGIAKLLGAGSGRLALGFVIMGVVLLVLTAILALIGLRQVRAVGPPTHTIAAAKNAADSIQQAVSRGVANAKTRELTAKNLPDDGVIDAPQAGDYR